MSDLAIRVENLGKRYQIGEREPYQVLRDVLAEVFTAPFRHLPRRRRPVVPGPNSAPVDPESTACHPKLAQGGSYIWALKDVSFEVKRGEVVGIIGRNGAGKSTLLKILSRITKPTEGRAEIHGRVGSLLEVGTGFHPELTGRENIYLNGTILGMKKLEIGCKFDEIVAFAELEKFIDTPVKHYSTGMGLRLAFAVAAHLEPEILLVDEVLAVGDTVFQKKCLGKMGAVANEGRTVLFVSHNMAAVNRLSKRGIWLDHGTIHMTDQTQSVVEAYLAAGSARAGERRWEDSDSALGNEQIRLQAIRVVNAQGQPSSTIEFQRPFRIEIEYDVRHTVVGARVGFFLINADGVVIFAPNDIEEGGYDTTVRNRGRYISACTVPGGLLNSGMYTVTASADVPGIARFFYEENAVGFHIERIGGAYSVRPDRLPGVICPSLQWQISSPPEATTRDHNLREMHDPDH